MIHSYVHLTCDDDIMSASCCETCVDQFKTTIKSV